MIFSKVLAKCEILIFCEGLKMNEFLQKAQQRREQRESSRAKRAQEGQKFGKRLDGYTQDLEKNLKNILDENDATNATNEEKSFAEALKARKSQAHLHSQTHSQARAQAHFQTQERAQKTLSTKTFPKTSAPRVSESRISKQKILEAKISTPNTPAPKAQNPQTPAPKQDLQNTKDSQIVKVSKIIKDSEDGWDSQITQITQITPNAEDSKIVYLHQQNTFKSKRANFDIKSRQKELAQRKLMKNFIQNLEIFASKNSEETGKNTATNKGILHKWWVRPLILAIYVLLLLLMFYIL